jgi:O-antigen biosynthesis alpha-1,2-mannosyltransferase
MRIVLDMQGAQTESRYRGIGRYSTALALAMLREPRGHDLWVLLNDDMREGAQAVETAIAGVVDPARVCRFASPGAVAWNAPANAWRRGAAEAMRETFLRDIQPDAVHISSLFEGTRDAAVTSVGRIDGGAVTAVTLYDLIPLLNPDKYLGDGWARAWYFDKLASLKRSRLLLSISEHARQEAIHELGFDPDGVVNISSAVSSIFRPAGLDAEGEIAFNERFALHRPYIMYSGAMDARKNVEGLIIAFGALPADLRASHDLLIAGAVDESEQARLAAVARRHGVADRLRFTGYVSDDLLVPLYSQAALYVFPSLHEGFGLPALEAMSCGTPTIGSSTTSIPEVIGRSDALFDPTSTVSMAEVMARALSDRDFASELRRHAPIQAAKFSWAESSRRALAALEAVNERSRHEEASWASVSADVQAHHHDLIATISMLPAVDEKPVRSDLVATAASIAANQDHALDALRRAGGVPNALAWRVEGPFDSSYSLALVNRELALALDGIGNEVALHSTEGPGDFAASEVFLAENPEVARLHGRLAAMPAAAADVSSRLLYPPRVADMQSRYNLLHAYAWEESGFPAEWVDAFNEHLQGISALSTHVEKILIDAGVRVPLSVSEAGVDHWERIVAGKAPELPAAGFRFLHVSSCFPRKGADSMLVAYGDAFTIADDVCLVIKTFENPHNEIHAWLEQARGSRKDFPRVHIIERDMAEAELKALYEACDVLVAPSRAEGFGLPMAEAMVSGLGVITTKWGGQLDFCDEETSWLVDFRFEEAKTHFGIFHSVWAEPDRTSLAEAMRMAHATPPAIRNAMVERGRDRLAAHFNWRAVAQRVDGFARGLVHSRQEYAPRIGWVTTWNKRCGIASYSDHLVRHMHGPMTIFAAEAEQRTAPDGPEVIRCWESEAPDSLLGLCAALDAEGIDSVVLQFQYGFFEFGPLADFLARQHDAGRSVTVMMHATQDPPHAPGRKLSMIARELGRCDRIFVHGVADLNRLKDLGLVDNVAIFPHGIVDSPVLAPRPATGPFVVASYGFFLPHKGLPELVEAMGLLSARGADVELRMINAEYPVGESKALIDATRAQIQRLGLTSRVTLVDAYLPDAESLARLGEADLIVFPYQGTAESSSAAVRYGLAAGRPVAVTPIAIFDDVGEAVSRLPGVSPEALADGIAGIMADARGGGSAARGVEIQAQRWRAAHRYSYLGRRLYNTLWALSGRRRRANYPQEH